MSPHSCLQIRYLIHHAAPIARALVRHGPIFIGALAFKFTWKSQAVNRDQCWEILSSSIRGLLLESGIEVGAISPATMLGAELGITSVDAIHLMLMLEDRLDHPFSFERLGVRDGEYVKDLSADEVFSFVCSSMGI
jgi:acyl carrier protein